MRPRLVRLSGLAATREPAGDRFIPGQGTSLVCGPVPSGGRSRDSHALMFRSLSPSLPPLKTINKISKRKSSIVNKLLWLLKGEMKDGHHLKKRSKVHCKGLLCPRTFQKRAGNSETHWTCRGPGTAKPLPQAVTPRIRQRGVGVKTRGLTPRDRAPHARAQCLYPRLKGTSPGTEKSF